MSDNRNLRLLSYTAIFAWAVATAPSFAKDIDTPTLVFDANKSGIGVAQIRSLLSTKNLIDVNNAIANKKTSTVPTIEAVAAPFQPGSNKCEIPKRIADNIKGIKNWTPAGLSDAINTIKVENVEYVNQASINVLMHTVELSRPASADWKHSLTITGVRSYTTFDPGPFMDTTRPSFLFTLDCSGYLNASMSAAGTFGVGDIKTASKTALSAKTTSMVARASIFSPFTAALRPADVPTIALEYLSVRDNMELLFGLISQLPADTLDTDQLLPIRQLDVLWTSASGETTAQNDASLAGGVSAALGFGSANSSAGAGFSINRRSNFKDFTTYIIQSPSSASTATSVKDLRTRFQTVAKNAKLLVPISVVNGDYLLRYDMPKLMCEQLQWTVSTALTGASELRGKIYQAIYSTENGCSLSAAFENESDLRSQKVFKLKGSGDNSKVNIEYVLKI